jgi:thioredoxin-like negative regulator of GroEL
MRPFLLNLFVTAAAMHAADNPPKAVVWNNHFDEASALAQKTGKPLLIEFWATWCGPCRMMDHDTWTDARVAARSLKYVTAAVDVDHDASTRSHYNVHEIPTVILADPWGEELVRGIGSEPPAAILEMMEKVPGDFNEVRDWREQIEHGNKDAAPLYRIGQFYEKTHFFDLSNLYYGRALKTESAKSEVNLLQNLQLSIGFNSYRQGNLNDARKSFQQFLRENTQAAREDEAMMGLVMVEIKQGKMPEAKKTFDVLQASHPASKATEAAARMIAAGKVPQ